MHSLPAADVHALYYYFPTYPIHLYQHIFYLYLSQVLLKVIALVAARVRPHDVHLRLLLHPLQRLVVLLLVLAQLLLQQQLTRRSPLVRPLLLPLPLFPLPLASLIIHNLTPLVAIFFVLHFYSIGREFLWLVGWLLVFTDSGIVSFEVIAE